MSWVINKVNCKVLCTLSYVETSHLEKSYVAKKKTSTVEIFFIQLEKVYTILMYPSSNTSSRESLSKVDVLRGKSQEKKGHRS